MTAGTSLQRTKIRAAIAGEALIDLIADPKDGKFTPCLGGAVYNLARALSRQGVGTTYLNPFSFDRLGQDLCAQMCADGVVLSQPAPIQAVTSLAVVNVNADGHPSYAFYREGVADRQVTSQQMQSDCTQHEALDLVCCGALALDPRDQDLYLPWLKTQKALGQCIVIDANLRPSVMPDLDSYRTCVMSFLNEADIIKVSDEDLAHLQLNGATHLEQAKHLLANTKAQLVALTLGAEGAWLLTASGIAVFAKEPSALAVIDTVGAGDSFLAGLLAALVNLAPKQKTLTTLNALSNAQTHQLLGHAIASASLCVQQRGCVPPTWQEAESWAEAHPSVV
ncbi:PfkB family carbohydrate kinase [Limnohabitans sp. B9-3]|uniref:PfkB family carbohydrate kinase n=1 Tax=Limnohabitans sp. B9-3 TaxID=1100707 RepID=UPI000C1F532E|nr:PfkB family carbohydrate kinase [Limnohabitans sp. B9-3]PIT77813.1 carbohydrate kinase [Limnohabitans sp. B9-3]